MRDGQVLNFKDSLNGDLEIGVEDGEFGTPCQELNELVQLLLVVPFKNLPQPLYNNRGLSVPLRVLDMGLDDINCGYQINYCRKLTGP